MEQLELRQYLIEAQPKEHEPTLCFRRGNRPSAAAQPTDVRLHAPAQFLASIRQKPFDRDLGLRHHPCGGDHRMVEHEGSDPGEPRKQGAGLLIQHPMGERCAGHSVILRAERSCCLVAPIVRFGRLPDGGHNSRKAWRVQRRGGIRGGESRVQGGRTFRKGTGNGQTLLGLANLAAPCCGPPVQRNRQSGGPPRIPGPRRSVLQVPGRKSDRPWPRHRPPLARRANLRPPAGFASRRL